ncbi:MAG: vWA domain-containing protein [Pseudolabrys sp.]
MAASGNSEADILRGSPFGLAPQDDGFDAGVLGPPTRLRLAGFARTLRDNGFRVGLAETRDALTVLAQPIAARPSTLKPALRALFCATHSDWERFDEIFDAFWLGHGRRQARVLSGAPSAKVSPLKRLAEAIHEQGRHGLPERVERRGEDGGDAAGGRERRAGAARAENLASVDLRHITDPADIAKAQALAERLARVMRARLVRREQPRRRGHRLDLRRTIHRSVSHGGVPVDLVWRRRKIKPLRLVVLLDASGSMNLYTAFFVRFLHGIVDAFREAEAFVFHTRLAHVSASLRDRDVGRAVDKLALMAQGIGGGTRIGECLATFNRWHARRVINSRTAVIIVSDGYDTGEPAHLVRQLIQLRQRCRRIIWLNPLIGWRDYTPAARGMQVALPYVDLFAPAHNLESLAALEPHLARI